MLYDTKRLCLLLDMTSQKGCRRASFIHNLNLKTCLLVMESIKLPCMNLTFCMLTYHDKTVSKKKLNDITSYLLADDGMSLSCGFCHEKVQQSFYLLDHLQIGSKYFGRVISVWINVTA